jgi:hypothetical protein
MPSSQPKEKNVKQKPVHTRASTNKRIDQALDKAQALVLEAMKGGGFSEQDANPLMKEFSRAYSLMQLRDSKWNPDGSLKEPVPTPA